MKTVNETISVSENRIQKSGILVIITMAILLSAANMANSQTSARIEGKLLNLKANKPVEFASIAILNLPDSALVKGSMSDDKGEFVFDELPYGNFSMKISCLGYEPVVKSNISLSPDKNLLNLGTVEMNEITVKLDEVVVEGERLKGVAEADKTVYTVNDKAISTSTSGLEVLRYVPAVQVDFQNNLTLEGSSNILILVDSKQRDKYYLAQLDPKSIDKIEIMTNPSVKYDADITGVINIILKKEARYGMSGRLEIEAPISDKLFSNTSANLEYGLGKVRVFGSVNYHIEKFNDIKIDTYRKSTQNGVLSEYRQDSDGKGFFMFGGFDYGVDWFINDKNTLNLYGNYRPANGMRFKMNYDKELLENNQTQAFFTSYNEDMDINASTYFSTFYKHNFNKPSQEFTLDVNYYNYLGDHDRFYKDQYYLTDKVTVNGLPIERTEYNTDNKQAFGLKADYTQPIAKDYKLSGGYNNYSQWMDNTFLSASDAQNQGLDYSEFRHSAYTNFSGAIKKFNFQTGVRFEASNININGESTSDYMCLLPQFTIQQKFEKSQSLKFTYRRSIQRPGISDLNPFVNYTDSVSISRGNPLLDASYTNKAELNYSIQYKGNYLSPSLYYTYFTNGFQRVSHVVQGGITESYIDNIGSGSEFGLSFSGSVNITKKWQLYPYFSIYGKKLDEIEKYGIKQQEKLSFRGSLTSVWVLPKDFSIFTFMQYSSPYISTQNTHKRYPIYVLGAEKQFNKKLKLTVHIINPFMKEFVAFQTITESEDFWQDTALKINIAHVYTIKLSYNFSNGGKINKLERSKELENDGKNSMF